MIYEELFSNIAPSERIDINASLAKHSEWVITHIYSKAYPDHEENIDKINRFHHGSSHINRVACWTVVFQRLRCLFGKDDTNQLSKEDLRLLEIAALFHDSGREGEERDYWDKDSAINCYYYLTKVCNIAQEKALYIAEVIANKDVYDSEKHVQLCLDLERNLTWDKNNNEDATSKYKRSLHQQILHDADCLDIIRARDIFEAEYLDFYQDIAIHDDKEAFPIMAKLITEARSLIARQGDSRFNEDKKVKQKYLDPKTALTLCLEDITPSDYPLLYNLLNADILSLDELNIIVNNKNTDEDLVQKLWKNQSLLARSIDRPWSNLDYQEKENKYALSNAELEFKKIHRKTSSSSGLFKPKVNPCRSTCLLMSGSQPYGMCGYLIPLNNSKVYNAGITDLSTGYKKKEYFKKNEMPNDVGQKLQVVQRKLMMGGANEKERNRIFRHCEIITDVEPDDVVGIFYCTEDCIQGSDLRLMISPKYKEAVTILQAHYLQALLSLNHEKNVKIYRYSYEHDKLNHMDINEETLLELWKIILNDWIYCESEKLLNGYNTSDDYKLFKILFDTNIDVEIIKMYILTGSNGLKNLKHSELYSLDLITAIDKTIKEEIRKARTKFKNTMQEHIELNLDKLLDSTTSTSFLLFQETLPLTVFNALNQVSIKSTKTTAHLVAATSKTDSLPCQVDLEHDNRNVYETILANAVDDSYLLNTSIGKLILLSRKFNLTSVTTKLQDFLQQEIAYFRMMPSKSTTLSGPIEINLIIFCNLFVIAKGLNQGNDSLKEITSILSMKLSKIFMKMHPDTPLKRSEFINLSKTLTLLESHKLLDDEFSDMIYCRINRNNQNIMEIPGYYIESCRTLGKSDTDILNVLKSTLLNNTMKLHFTEYSEFIETLFKHNFFTDEILTLILKQNFELSFYFVSIENFCKFLNAIILLKEGPLTQEQQNLLGMIFAKMKNEHPEIQEIIDHINRKDESVDFQYSYLIQDIKTIMDRINWSEENEPALAPELTNAPVAAI